MIIKIGRTLSAVILATLGSLEVAAEPSKPVSSEVYFDVATSAGRATICSVQFTMMYPDHTYKLGNLVGVTGSISWMGDSSKLGIMFKVVGSDLESLNPPSFQKFRIATASINAGNTNYQPKIKLQCEDDAAYCGIYPLESGIYFLEAANNQNLYINYNRHDTGIDIVLPLIMKSDLKKETQFYRCMQELIGKVAQ